MQISYHVQGDSNLQRLLLILMYNIIFPHRQCSGLRSKQGVKQCAGNTLLLLLLLLNKRIIIVTWDSYSRCEGTVQN